LPARYEVDPERARRLSACADESVVYPITRAKASDSIAVDARKMVTAREAEMGILTCNLLSVAQYSILSKC